MFWKMWDPEFQKVKAQSDAIFDEKGNSHKSCLHDRNESDTDMFGLPEDEDYIKEMDNGGHPHGREDWQPTQLGKRSTSHMCEVPDEKAENSHSRRLRQEDQTAQGLAADAENITHSRRLLRKDQTAWSSAAAMKKWSQVPPAAAVPAPDPPIGSRVTRSKSKASAEALTASAADPFTYVQAMPSPQWDHSKRAMEEECTLILLNNTFSALNSQEGRQLQVRPIGST